MDKTFARTKTENEKSMRFSCQPGQIKLDPVHCYTTPWFDRSVHLRPFPRKILHMGRLRGQAYDNVGFYGSDRNASISPKALLWGTKRFTFSIGSNQGLLRSRCAAAGSDDKRGKVSASNLERRS